MVDTLGLPDLDAMAAEHRAIEEERAAARILALNGDVTEAAAQAQSLWQERQGHPCHECPRRNEHRDYLAQVDRLDKDRRALKKSSAEKSTWKRNVCAMSSEAFATSCTGSATCIGAIQPRRPTCSPRFSTTTA